MKSNNINVYKKMSVQDLEKELKALQETVFKLRFKKVVEEIKDTTQSKKARKQIAQIKTLLRQQATQE